MATPRIVLRYVSDQLGALAAKGIHDPATMPLRESWTDVPSPQLDRNSLQYYWRNRAPPAPSGGTSPLAGSWGLSGSR